MLGTSLGGIGKKVSTMTTLGEVATRALRAAHETLWASAEVIEPKQQSSAETASVGVPAKASVSKKAPAKKAASRQAGTSKSAK